MNDFEKFKASVEEVKTSIFGEIDSIIEKIEQSGDVEKFYDKGTKSAAGRLRRELQLIRKSVHNPTVRNHMNSIVDNAKDLRETLK